MKIISSTHQSKDMKVIIQLLTSLFECIKKENNNMISDKKEPKGRNEWFNFWFKGRLFNLTV